MRMQFFSVTGLVVVASAIACSTSSSPSSSPSPTDSTRGAAAWSCASVPVPYGSRIECSATGLSVQAGTYTCVPGTEIPCPPPGAYDGGTTDVPDTGMGDDGGCGCGSSSGGSSGGYSSSGSSSGGMHGGGSSSGGGNASSGGHGPHPGGDGGSPTCTWDAGGGGPGGDGGTVLPTYTCQSSPPQVDCQQEPTCAPGTHPAPCGACVPDDACDCQPPSEGGCWVTGGGFVPDDGGKDTFGGNAMPLKDGTIRGEWENQGHDTASNAHGQAQYLFCRNVPGPGPGHPNGPQHNFDDNQVYFGGPATLNGASGYWFDVVAEDHGEPGRQDTYQITLRQYAGPSQPIGPVVFQESGTLAGGNIQIHPPNGGHPAAQSALPPWVQLQP